MSPDADSSSLIPRAQVTTIERDPMTAPKDIPRPPAPSARLRFYAAAGVFFLAALVRLAYWSEIRGSALDRWRLWDQSDMSTYLEQSRRIAQRDWLAREPYRPYHRWQRFASEQRWEAWSPSGSFHQAPAYSYALAVARRMSPRFVDVVKLTQLALGALCAVFVFLLAERIAGLAAGVVAGLLAALHGPMIYIELQILKEGPAIFLLLCAMLCFQRASSAAGLHDRPKAALGAIFAGGVFMGALSLTHEIGPVALVGLAIWVLFRAARTRSRLWLIALAVFAGGYLLAMTPLLLRNLLVGAPPFSISSRSIVVFAMSNEAGAPEGGALWGAVGPGLPAVLDEAGGSFFRLLRAVARTYEGDLGLMISNWFAKARALAAVYEAPDNTSYDFYRARARTLQPLLAFWALFAPGLGGVAVTFARFMQGLKAPRDDGSEVNASWTAGAGPLLAVLLALGASMTFVHSIGRIRLFLVPLLAVFAAVFAVEVARRARGRASAISLYRGAPIWIFLLAAGFQLYAQRRVAPDSPRATDFVVAANLERQAGDFDAASRDYERAIALGRREADLYYALGLTHWNAARPEAALESLERGLRESSRPAPRTGALERFLAWVLATSPLAELRDAERALELAEEAVRLASSEDPLALETRAAARAELGDFEGALTDSAAALRRALVHGMEPLAARIRDASQGYRERRPYRDPIARAAP